MARKRGEERKRKVSCVGGVRKKRKSACGETCNYSRVTGERSPLLSLSSYLPWLSQV